VSTPNDLSAEERFALWWMLEGPILIAEYLQPAGIPLAVKPTPQELAVKQVARKAWMAGLRLECSQGPSYCEGKSPEEYGVT
jgi:hypothetical protein